MHTHRDTCTPVNLHLHTHEHPHIHIQKKCPLGLQSIEWIRYNQGSEQGLGRERVWGILWGGGLGHDVIVLPTSVLVMGHFSYSTRLLLMKWQGCSANINKGLLGCSFNISAMQ